MEPIKSQVVPAKESESFYSNEDDDTLFLDVSAEELEEFEREEMALNAPEMSDTCTSCKPCFVVLEKLPEERSSTYYTHYNLRPCSVVLVKLPEEMSGTSYNLRPCCVVLEKLPEDTTSEVYQRKLARLVKNEEHEDLDEEIEPPIERHYTESPVSSSTFESYSASPFLNIDDLRRRPLSRVAGKNIDDVRHRPLSRVAGKNIGDLRRRPLSRVAGEKWSDDSNLSPHKAWSPDDIVTQVQPPPEEEKKSSLISTTLNIGIIAILVFIYSIYNNMESTPQNPFS